MKKCIWSILWGLLLKHRLIKSVVFNILCMDSNNLFVLGLVNLVVVMYFVLVQSVEDSSVFYENSSIGSIHSVAYVDDISSSSNECGFF